LGLPEGVRLIRRAKKFEADELTRISFASKGYWGYPQAYFDIWLDELTIGSDYIRKNNVFVYESGEAIIGYYALVELEGALEVSGVIIKKGFWLEHMFLEPEHIGIGIGRSMFDHLHKYCRTNGIAEVGILADPNARGFYEKMGCEYVNEYPSTIKDRTTPYLRLRL
jgi:GNAT superfamily N-acetyltransferase